MKISILKSKDFTHPASLLVASILFSGAIAEATVRYLDLAPERVSYWATNIRHKKVEHCAQGFCVTYTLNTQGLRAPRDYGIKQPGTLRIVIVGDSFTFGWGVEDNETIPFYVRQYLSQSYPERHIEVINLGVPGTNPHRFLRYVMQYAKLLEADIVVQNLFEVRNTYFGLEPVTFETLKREQLDQWILQSQKPDFDPERRFQKTFWWKSGAFRLMYRAWLKYVRGIDYRTFNADWGGPEATSAMQPAPIEGQECARQKEATQLCSQNFHLPKEWDSRAADARLQLLDKFQKKDIIESACACDLPPQFVLMLLENALLPWDATMLMPDTVPQIEAGAKLAIATTAAEATAAHDFGANFVAIVLPNYFRFVEYDPNHFLWQVTLLDHRLIESNRLTNYLMTSCRDFQIDCVNGVERMKAFAQGKVAEKLVLPDSHFTASTNREFAKIIGQALIDQFGEKFALKP